MKPLIEGLLISQINGWIADLHVRETYPRRIFPKQTIVTFIEKAIKRNPATDRRQSISKDTRLPNRETMGTAKNMVQYIPMREDVAMNDF